MIDKTATPAQTQESLLPEEGKRLTEQLNETARKQGWYQSSNDDRVAAAQKAVKEAPVFTNLLAAIRYGQEHSEARDGRDHYIFAPEDKDTPEYRVFSGPNMYLPFFAGMRIVTLTCASEWAERLTDTIEEV